MQGTALAPVFLDGQGHYAALLHQMLLVLQEYLGRLDWHGLWVMKRCLEGRNYKESYIFVFPFGISLDSILILVISVLTLCLLKL